jgi:putative copper resistance protein D
MTGIAPRDLSRLRSNKDVLAAAVITFRFLQYAGTMILFGSSLFFIYGLPGQGPCAAASYPWPKRLLAFSAALLVGAAILGLITQTGLLAGSFGEGFKLDNLEAVITQMNFGLSAIVRAAIAAALLLWLIILTPSRLAWAGSAAGGAVMCASLAWMGHGAATEGPAGIVHLLGDVVHSLAAAVWIGALVAFVFLLLLGPSGADSDGALHESLRRFSGIGSITVALIVLSGLVNSWFLVGPQRLLDFWTTAYGQVLLAKLLAFAGMLGLAASNRYRLTPALGDALGARASRDAPLSALRRSLLLETTTAFVVLGLVAWLGTLPPPSAA